MTGLQDNEPMPEWVDDEDPDFDELPERVAEMDDVVETPRERAPLWRLIEMSREDRSLKMELADFDQYDEYDNFGDRSH